MRCLDVFPFQQRFQCISTTATCNGMQELYVLAEEACVVDAGGSSLNVYAVLPDAIHPIGKCMIDSSTADGTIKETCDASSPGALPLQLHGARLPHLLWLLVPCCMCDQTSWQLPMQTPARQKATSLLPGSTAILGLSTIPSRVTSTFET